MEDPIAIAGHRYWTLNKLIVLALSGAFIILLLDTRLQHQYVLTSQPVAWTPIIFCVVMLVFTMFGLLFWDNGGRSLLSAGFAVATIVGALGFYFHTHGHLTESVHRMLETWNAVHTGGNSSLYATAPPLAPLTFCWLGLIGMVACSKRLQQPSIVLSGVTNPPTRVTWPRLSSHGDGLTQG